MNRDVYRPLYEAGADMVVLEHQHCGIRLMTFEEAWAIMENELESELTKQREEKTNVKQKRKYRSKTRPSSKLWLAYQNVVSIRIRIISMLVKWYRVEQYRTYFLNGVTLVRARSTLLAYVGNNLHSRSAIRSI